MFCEDKFIKDFIDANLRNIQEEDVDYEDVKVQISTYCNEMIYGYTDEDFKNIAILYHGDVVTSDYKTIAIEELYKLFPKILAEYMDTDSSEVDTDLENYDDENDDNEEFDVII